MIICVTDPFPPNVQNIITPKPLELSTRVSKNCDRATLRLRKILQRLRKIWVFERRNAQFTIVLLFLGNFCLIFCCWFLAHFVCARLSNRHIGRPKKKFLESLPRTWIFVTMFTTLCVSCVTCAVLRVMCHMSHVRFHVSINIYIHIYMYIKWEKRKKKKMEKSGAASWWKVFYLRGYPIQFF